MATAPTSGRPTLTADVRIDHYAIEPGELAVTAGALTLTVTNADRVPHDVVLLRTARLIDALPTDGVRVDEHNPAVEVLGRTPRLAAVWAASSPCRCPPAGTCWCARCRTTTSARRWLRH